MSKILKFKKSLASELVRALDHCSIYFNHSAVEKEDWNSVHMVKKMQLDLVEWNVMPNSQIEIVGDKSLMTFIDEFLRLLTHVGEHIEFK